MYYVYILKSEVNQSYYRGCTDNLERRFSEHNAGKEKSTNRYKPWVLVWHTIKPTRSEALVLEKKLKNITSRQKITDFILKHS